MAGYDTPTVARGHQSAITRIAAWSARHPWWAITFWLLFVAITFVGGSAGGLKSATDAQLQVGQAATATNTQSAAGLADPAVENVLISARSGALDQSQANAAAAQVRTRMLALTGQVSAVGAPQPDSAGTALIVQVTMSGDPDTADDRVTPLLAATAQVQQAFPALRVEEAGSSSITDQFNSWINQDLATAAKYSVPITLLILILAFGSLWMAGLPVLLALSAVASALGLWYLASQVLPDPGTVPDLILLMGMAVGVDYSLFYLRRYREELRDAAEARAAGGPPLPKSAVRRAALEVAAATSGHAVITSGTAGILALSALYITRDPMFTPMAAGASLVIAVAMLSSLTVLPAVLGRIGRTELKPTRRERRALKEQAKQGGAPVAVLGSAARPSRGGPSRVWGVLLRPAIGHPLLSLLVAAGALLALALPAASMSLKATQLADFPGTLSTMQTYDRILGYYPDDDDTDIVVCTAPAGGAAAMHAELQRLTTLAQANPLFAADPAVAPRYSADGLTGVVELDVPYSFDNPKSKQSVTALRDQLVPETVGTLSGTHTEIGGDIAADMDYTANLLNKLPLVVGLVLALTFLVMLFVFRSPVIALTTVLLNLLSTAASFGVLCLIFQRTWADKLLRFTSTGHIVSWVPMLLFVVLSGLSLDYHVFVVTRIREEARGGLPTRAAVRAGITRTAGVVTSAAAVMVGVFSVFGGLDFIALKQIGVGLAAAIVLDATVVRIVLLPSMMSLFGRANWWPARLERPAAALSGPRPRPLEQPSRSS